MQRTATLAPGLPEVCRLGLATRGGSRLTPEDVEWAVDRGVNYLNWCGYEDGMSQAIASLGRARSRVVVALQFHARTASKAKRKFETLLEQLRTGYIDVATLYYIETPEQWEEIISPGGSLEYLQEQKQAGRLRLIGLTSHQRDLAAGWAKTGVLDMLMIRYNAAHRGAESDIFPITSRRRMPVVTYTGLRWKALLKKTPDDPAGFRPPSPADCYRFCLANKHVAVALTAPSNRGELEHNLTLLDDWRPPTRAEMNAMRAHGDRVHRHASVFW